VICRHCDHGNCYCPDDDCGEQARIEAKRRYRADYQNTRDGRLNHAARQAQYRLKLARSGIASDLDLVTDQGSTGADSSTTMPGEVAISADQEEKSDARPVTTPKTRIQCSFCGRFCGPYVHRWLGRWL
jgi:hypothetical protein